MILLATDVIVYALNEDAPAHDARRRAVEAAPFGRIPGVVFPQVLLEAYAVLTDARRVAHPLLPADAWDALGPARRGVRVLLPTASCLDCFGERIGTEGPGGRDVFDGVLVAQMIAHGGGALCTYDTEGFRSYRGITVLTPDEPLDRYTLR